jgi:hypothetical protein
MYSFGVQVLSVVLLALMFEFLRFRCVQEKGQFSKHGATVTQHSADCGEEVRIWV